MNLINESTGFLKALNMKIKNMTSFRQKVIDL